LRVKLRKNFGKIFYAKLYKICDTIKNIIKKIASLILRLRTNVYVYLNFIYDKIFILKIIIV